MSVLKPVPAVLEPFLARLRPCAPRRLSLDAAIGAIAAETVIAPHALPQQACALRAGFAVHSDETLGATPHEPMLLAMIPPSIRVGDVLPSGADAIAEPGLIGIDSGLAAISAPLAPGEGSRRAGHDLAAGAPVLDAGDVVTPEAALALALSGVTELAVRRPVVGYEGGEDRPECAWLLAHLKSRGVILASGDEPADLRLRLTRDGRPTLAMAPGECAELDLSGKTPFMLLPARFDALVAATFRLVLPALACLTQARSQAVTWPLSAALRSGIGKEDAVLLAREGHHFRPLMTGAITLDALLMASHIGFVEAALEGLDHGAPFTATPIHPCPALFGGQPA